MAANGETLISQITELQNQGESIIKKDITGLQVRRWLAVEPDNSNKGEGQYWLFKCLDCGHIESMTFAKSKNTRCECMKNGVSKSQGTNITFVEDANDKNVLLLYQDHSFYVGKIDKADKRLVEKYAWTTNKQGYLYAGNYGRVILLHRYIYFNGDYDKALKSDYLIDHINGIRTDNRRCNIRLSDRTQNAWNRKDKCTSKTGMNGVRYLKDLNKYRVTIKANGVTYKLGDFDSFEEAKIARIEGEEKYYGEFARHK